MRRQDRPTAWNGTVYLAVIVLLALAATPLPATESDLAAAPAKTEQAKVEDAKAEAAGEAQAAAGEEPNEGVCIDADTGQTTAVNTLEDIYSIASGNVAALLKMNTQPPADPQPEVEEVRWTEVEKNDEKAEPAQKKKKEKN